MPQPLSKIMTKYGEVFMPQDLALTAQTQWKTQPGIQVITGDHGSECCCVCCCCKEPELIFASPGKRNCRSCKPEKEESIGVFVTGRAEARNPEWSLEEWKEKQRVADDTSGITKNCARYRGESWLYNGQFGPIETKDLSNEIADRPKQKICEKYYWDDKARRPHWRLCSVLNIDLFGFSRGAATVLRVAELLNKEFECPDCPDIEDKLPRFLVRFLGIIDPFSWMAPKAGPLPEIRIPGTPGSVPSNVLHFFAAYSKNPWASHVDLPDEDDPSSSTKAVEDPRYEIPHGEMDDDGGDPMTSLLKNYNESVPKSEQIDPTGKGTPCEPVNPREFE
jgi:hypothetical protein